MSERSLVKCTISGNLATGSMFYMDKSFKAEGPKDDKIQMVKRSFMTKTNMMSEKNSFTVVK
jgi:hypothetical protein